MILYVKQTETEETVEELKSDIQVVAVDKQMVQ